MSKLSLDTSHLRYAGNTWSSLIRLSSIYLALAFLLSSGCRFSTQPATAPPAPLPQVVAFRTATPEPAPTLSTLLEGQALIQALRQGGYVIFFRHAATYRSQLDTDPQNLDNCQTQRNLDETGQAQAAAIGQAFRQAQIPIGDILASPYCRTRDTAQIAFGRVELTDDLINPYSQEDEAQIARLGRQLRQLLNIPPRPGMNTILVGHTPNLLAATELSIIEGEAAIFAPNGQGGFSLVARVLPDEWTALAAESEDRQ